MLDQFDDEDSATEEAFEGVPTEEQGSKRPFLGGHDVSVDQTENSILHDTSVDHSLLPSKNENKRLIRPKIITAAEASPGKDKNIVGK